MSDFHLPPFTPIYPITKVVRPRVRGQRRPAWGIEQRKTVGLNQTSPEWDVQWLLPFTDANTLETFLATRAARNEWFLWTPPNGVQGYYRCDDWTKNVGNHKVFELRARFRQVFGFDLPSITPGVGEVSVNFKEFRVLRGYILAADIGTIVSSGADANFQIDIPMPVSTGTLTLAGNDAAFLRGYLLTAEVTEFDTTGIPATLIYFSLSSNYFGSMSDQVYGWDRDFQVDWWGD